MFVYKQWDNFCRKLKDNGFASVSAATILKIKPDKPFLVLKHDMETNPLKALRLAQIESKYSHKGSYYAQAYLLNDSKNIDILKQIKELGHEVSYHHDVMDSNKGDIYKAVEEFQRNIELFENNDFLVQTVCQHGNPIIDRDGYSSNRDFFRNAKVAQLYEHISEIMVNFKSRINEDYKYISDVGYGWKIIFDPENNDVVNSEEKDIALENLDKVLDVIKSKNSVIVCTHPHRWHSNVVSAQAKEIVFKSIKYSTKCMLKIPFMKKMMGKFYYLAKKI